MKKWLTNEIIYYLLTSKIWSSLTFSFSMCMGFSSPEDPRGGGGGVLDLFTPLCNKLLS